MSNLLSHQDRTILLNALTDADPFATVRGRQMIVRNALAGFPMSAKIDKALRWLDWEGAPLVVADNLLRLLEGHEPAPRIPALALIAKAIEPVSAMVHREKLAELRRRMAWGGSDPSSSSETWRDYRPPADVNRERIIGENTLRPLYYLRRALIAAEAVVRIDLNGHPAATGFLVAPDLMITNHHVIVAEQQAQSARAYFFDEVPDQRDQASGRQPVVASPAPSGALLYTHMNLEVTLVRLQGCPQLSPGASPAAAMEKRALPRPHLF